MEVDELAASLVTGRGFIRAFWAELRKRRAEDPGATQQDAFWYLNNHFEEVFGEPRFPSFDAFRKYRDRRRHRGR